MPSQRLELKTHETYGREPAETFRAPHDKLPDDAVYVDPGMTPEDLVGDGDPQACYDTLAGQYGVPATRDGAKAAIGIYLRDNPSPAIAHEDLNALAAHCLTKAYPEDLPGCRLGRIVGNDAGITYLAKSPDGTYSVHVGAFDAVAIAKKAESPLDPAGRNELLVAMLEPMRILRAMQQDAVASGTLDPAACRMDPATARQAKPDDPAAAADREAYAIERACAVFQDDPAIYERYGFDFPSTMLDHANELIRAGRYHGIQEPAEDLNGLYEALLDKVSSSTRETASKRHAAAMEESRLRQALDPLYEQDDVAVDPDAIEIAGPFVAPRDQLPSNKDRPKAIRNGDLQALALYAMLDAASQSDARNKIRSVGTLRNHGASHAIPVCDAAGRPTGRYDVRVTANDRTMSDPDSDAAKQTIDEPASHQDVFHAIHAAFHETRHVEQFLYLTGDAPAASHEEREIAVGLAVCQVNPVAYRFAYDFNAAEIDANLQGYVRARDFCRRHPELKDTYGFDFEKAAVADMNLKILSGQGPLRYDDLLDSFDELVEKTAYAAESGHSRSLSLFGRIPRGYDPATEPAGSPMAGLYDNDGINELSKLSRDKLESAIVENAIVRTDAGSASPVEAWLVRNSPVFSERMDLAITAEYDRQAQARRDAIAAKIRKAYAVPPPEGPASRPIPAWMRDAEASGRFGDYPEKEGESQP